MKLPQHVFLNTSADFKKFEETLKILGDKNLYPTWDWSFKVGGKIEYNMEKENPKFKEGPKLIDLVVQKDKDEDLKHEVQKQEEVKNLNANLAENGKEAPRPPMYHHISAKMAEIMGKREWERAAVGESDKFFRLDWMEEESSSFLANRKEIWDWCVVCVEGEGQKKLFCTHILKETDRWDLWHLIKNLKAFLSTENYRTFGEKYRKFYTAGINQGEDIFTFMSRLAGYKEEIGRLEDLALEAGTRLGDPQLFESLQILTAIEKIPEYSFYSQRVLLMPSKEWIQLKPEQIRAELHKIHSNRAALAHTEGGGGGS